MQIDAEKDHSRPRHTDRHRRVLLAAGKGSSPSESTSAGCGQGRATRYMAGRRKRREGKWGRDGLGFQNSQQFFTICVRL